MESGPSPAHVLYYTYKNEVVIVWTNLFINEIADQREF